MSLCDFLNDWFFEFFLFLWVFFLFFWLHFFCFFLLDCWSLIFDLVFCFCILAFFACYLFVIRFLLLFVCLFGKTKRVNFISLLLYQTVWMTLLTWFLHSSLKTQASFCFYFVESWSFEWFSQMIVSFVFNISYLFLFCFLFLFFVIFFFFWFKLISISCFLHRQIWITPPHHF